MSISLDYPHDTRTHQPLDLTLRDIWRLGSEARSHVDRRANPCLDVRTLVTQTRSLRVNGIDLATHWVFASEVRDDRGHPVLGAIEFDPEVPQTALVSLNSTELAGSDERIRSTAAHELGHAIFDAPGWMVEDARGREGSCDTRRFRRVVRRYRSAARPSTEEWRANEFMGAFLVPPTLLRHQIRKVLGELRLPRHLSSSGRPMLDASRLGFAEVEAVVAELAQRFGLSMSFIEYRLVRYGFAPGSDP
jgi:hypothetical protein